MDDEKIICSMAADFLEMQGFIVDTYEDSREALDAFRRDPDDFDIVITDQVMPELTGLELLKRMNVIKSGIPHILCTGFSEELNRKEKDEVGIDAFFMKPYRFDDLIGQIKKLIQMC
ncbi:MAG: response regulator [Spirochaetales bacterium]|nr:response regulator [Spirochaetales bacterium]